ncbi:hypothetical protein [Paraglaciecola sp. L3A3]|uniref:hypothetical protein n=1 Tax=Paraglaciecola sp. L3A3 TaxID=2686358 RepID=UPI00131E88E0|nr:hypothetical protein [Paraglaciecola sp. L3A3]
MFNKTIDKHLLSNLLQILGISLLAYVFFTYSFSIIGFWFKLPLIEYSIFASLLLIAFFVFKTSKVIYFPPNYIVIILGIFFGIIFLSVFLSQSVYGTAYDGLTYHREAIIQIKEGWNPVYNDVAQEVPTSLWVNHYPKWTWIYSAAHYHVFNSVEAGKSYQLILCMALFLLSLSTLLSIKNTTLIISLITSLLICLNPIFINQIFTYYVDGIIYVLMLIIVFSCFQINVNNNNYWWTVLFFSTVLLINTKFTGIPYYCVIILGWLTYILARKGIKQSFIFGIRSFIVLVLAICLFGYDTYIKNLLDFGHPFYPLYGAQPVDIMTHNTPSILASFNSFERYFISLFHSVSNSLNGGMNLKFPFIIDSLDEVSNSIKHDARLSGFGVLFSGIFIISVISLIYIAMQKKLVYSKFIFTLIIFFLMFSVFIHPESWWARYTPQMWLFPIIMIFILSKLNNKFSQGIYFSLIMTMLLNSLVIFSGMALKTTLTTIDINKELRELKTNDSLLYINFSPFYSIRARLQDENIIFQERTAEQLKKCNNLKVLKGSYNKVTYCYTL